MNTPPQSKWFRDAPKLRHFQSPYAIFHVYVSRKNHAGGTETDVTQGLHARHVWLHFYTGR